jgi:sarcosine oxidase subunit gamma
MSDRRFAGIVAIEDTGPAGMVTLRADLAAATTALKAAGVAVPDRRRTGDGSLWMSPDELLILCPRDGAADKVAAISGALKGTHFLAVDVSDARVMFRITGQGSAIRETLAKLSPADLRGSALPVGEVRRTRFAQVAAAFWFESEDEARLICFRSVADYVFGLLTHAARPGSEVGHFR